LSSHTPSSGSLVPNSTLPAEGGRNSTLPAEGGRSAASGSASCFLLPSGEAEAPFSPEDLALVRQYFLGNINVDGSGAVVAAPDHDSGSGGNYWYHWERDAALSMYALMETLSSEVDVDEYMRTYASWVRRAQDQPVMHSGTDIRVEPKYEIPSGAPVAGMWCRPQTDGPGLRAKTLSQYGLSLLKSNQTDFVMQHLWAANGSSLHGSIITYDLDWVVHNWRQDSCDLWEEIVSGNLFWGRYTMRAGLHYGAQLAQAVGDMQKFDEYMAAKREIERTLMSHWDGSFVDECRNFTCSSRRRDSAVIEAFNVGDLEDGEFAPLSEYVLGTVITLNELFCTEYEINRLDTVAGVPGVLYGRYSGDDYEGGNPWILLTASLARLIYRQAAAARAAPSVSSATYEQLQKAYGIGPGLAGQDLGDALLRAGDGVLLRIKHHADDEELHMAEQLDRESGEPKSAQDLTWNYANILLAMRARDIYIGR